MSTKSPQTLSAYVLEVIREGILSGRYEAGSRIDQQMVADELGVSLIPIREGLRQLEAEGLVQIHPRRGVYVAERSVDEVKEISLVREVLEELATQQAMPNLNQETLDRLAELLQQTEQAIDAEDIHQLLDLNKRFHFTIYETSGQNLLLRLIRSLWERNFLYRHRDTFLLETALRSLADHQEIYAACCAGDAVKAGQIMRRHIRQATKGIVTKMSLIKPGQ